MLSRIAQSLGLVTILALVTTTPFAAGAAGSVVRKGSRLSLNFHDTALKGVLQQLQRDAQITVKVPPSLLDRTVTVKLQNMEIDPALETLFKSASLDNFAIVHISLSFMNRGRTAASPWSWLKREKARWHLLRGFYPPSRTQAYLKLHRLQPKIPRTP
jgi:hypothetical protein